MVKKQWLRAERNFSFSILELLIRAVGVLTGILSFCAVILYPQLGDRNQSYLLLLVSFMECSDVLGAVYVLSHLMLTILWGRYFITLIL